MPEHKITIEADRYALERIGPKRRENLVREWVEHTYFEVMARKQLGEIFQVPVPIADEDSRHPYPDFDEVQVRITTKYGCGKVTYQHFDTHLTRVFGPWPSARIDWHMYVRRKTPLIRLSSRDQYDWWGKRNR